MPTFVPFRFRFEGSSSTRLVRGATAVRLGGLINGLTVRAT